MLPSAKRDSWVLSSFWTDLRASSAVLWVPIFIFASPLAGGPSLLKTLPTPLDSNYEIIYLFIFKKYLRLKILSIYKDPPKPQFYVYVGAAFWIDFFPYLLSLLAGFEQVSISGRVYG